MSTFRNVVAQNVASWRALASWRIAALGVYYIAVMVAFHQDQLKGWLAIGLGLLVFHQDLIRLGLVFLVGSWRHIDAERDGPSDSARHHRAGGDAKTAVVYTTVAASLLLIRYFGGRGMFHSWTHDLTWFPKSEDYNQLVELAFWSLSRVVVYIVPPWLVLRFGKGPRLRDCGLRTDGFAEHLKIYGLLYALVLPPLLVAASTKPFLHTYPFYGQASRSWLDFASWELLYVLQFFALELFFRGFMLHPLKRALGSRAIFAMAVPYCMIHFRKPLAEAAGAYIAGVVLGTLSLRTRSIWAGVLIHATVALTMDIFALLHGKGLPSNLW